MTTPTPMPLHRLITGIVFLCGALIASLFIYHTTHHKPLIQHDQAVIFPVARDLPIFSLSTTDNQAFSNRNLMGHWTLLFFGFAHCNTVCPVTLTTLSTRYPTLKAVYPNLQLVFVTLDPTHDTSDTLRDYLKSTHAQFIGVTGKLETIRKLQAQFGIYVASDPAHPDQLQHAANLILINPKGQWQAIIHPDAITSQITAQQWIALLQASEAAYA
jgi:protein SCO1/2